MDWGGVGGAERGWPCVKKGGGGGTKMALTRVASTGTTGNSERPPLTASPANPAASLVPGDCSPHPPRPQTRSSLHPSQTQKTPTGSRKMTLALQATSYDCTAHCTAVRNLLLSDKHDFLPV